MPYIDKDRRDIVDVDFNIAGDNPTPPTPGELNYIITKIIHEWIEYQGGVTYTRINTVIGALECAKLEFYRMIAAPYENEKHKQNSSVSELDKFGV